MPPHTPWSAPVTLQEKKPWLTVLQKNVWKSISSPGRGLDHLVFVLLELNVLLALAKLETFVSSSLFLLAAKRTIFFSHIAFFGAVPLQLDLGDRLVAARLGSESPLDGV